MIDLGARRKLRRFLFSYRFLFVSLLNFLAGNLIFTFLWLINANVFAYWQIAFITTVLASIFSFQTQSRIVLRKNSTLGLINLRYLIFQIVGLASSIAFVPSFAQFFSVNLLLIQLIWSALFSVFMFIFLIFKRD